MLKFHIITIFPNIFNCYFNESIIKRAKNKNLIQINIYNLRDFAVDKYKTVDDRPYGGGPGMVLQIQPIIRAVEFVKSKIKNKKSKIKVILFTPAGKQFNNKTAIQLAKNYDHLILICGRYEGIDARIKKIISNCKLEIEEISIGPYVLTGGEVPAMVVVDAVSRHICGVLQREESLEEKRYGIGIPVYTRPEIFIYKRKKYRVPKVLLSGNHKKIDQWRKKFKERLEGLLTKNII